MVPPSSREASDHKPSAIGHARYRQLLVPLDGSTMAESALPVAAALAGRVGGRVTLLHVLEPHPPATIHGGRHLTAPLEAAAYLSEVESWLTARRLEAVTMVRAAAEEVADGIAHGAAEAGADLVVLCTHGSRGIRGLLFGRVAQQVLARGRTPVLLTPPWPEGREHRFDVTRILVPVDGSDAAEAALAPAVTLAAEFRAEVHLARVVPTVETISGERGAASRLMPNAASQLLQDEAVAAADYLEALAGRIPQQIACNVHLLRGEPVRALLDMQTREGMQLWVVATHGRSGVRAVWAGSVAQRLLEKAGQVVLLVRVE